MERADRLRLAAAVAISLLVLILLAGRQLLGAPSPLATPAASSAQVAQVESPPATPTILQATGVPPTRTVTLEPERQLSSSPIVANIHPQTPTPGPTVAPDLALEYSSVRPNQYLGTIAARYGVSVEDIVAFSRIENPDVVSIGQGLIIPHRTDRTTPAENLLPDSEMVYGPSYVDLDLDQFTADQGGFLASVSVPTVDGTLSGAQLIERVALRFSVGPRVLLALMEARSGWVTDPEPDGLARDYPLGHTAGAPGLYAQLEWAANELNRGFYGWLDRGETAIRFADGTVARGHPDLNPATVAVQRVLAADSSYGDTQAETEAFATAYRQLFGDPFQLDYGPVLPPGLEQPDLHVPWPAGEWWYLTGGPHGAWFSGSGWAALDFVPESTGVGTCIPSDSWAVAAAPGVVAWETTGEILLDLDGDGDVRTGWVLQYLHITDRVPQGTVLAAGDRVGRPSCEGGAAETTHLHFSRRYNGLWVDAGGILPMNLDGWTAWGTFEYEGGMRKPGQVDREACHCRERERNGLTWQNADANGSSPAP
jgi:LysM repeat protein